VAFANMYITVGDKSADCGMLDLGVPTLINGVGLKPPMSECDFGHMDISDADTSDDDDDHDAASNRTDCAIREQSLLFFDWDDTLLPSSFILQNGLKLTDDSTPTQEQWAHLKQASMCAASTLGAAKRYGRVVVVTSAERGWVEVSAQKFSPWILPALEGVKIISARTVYEQSVGKCPFEWKYHAFEHEINDWNAAEPDNAFSNIVSIGDAGHERHALLRTVNSRPNCFGKSVKLVERPSIEHLLKQHEILRLSIRELVRHEGSLDLCFTF